MSLRCLLVDDSARFLEAARALLERGGVEVVGIASTGADAVSRARETAPDVVLVDLDLDGENGFDVARRLVRDVPAVILISTHSREDFQELIAASPARGFLHKSSLSARAIRDVLSDGGPAAPP
ncbi:Response regulator receiver domain-containing protein [Streptomyces sp. 3213]|uniref:response regulator n=1 Tax=Streptomyces sp. 3213.3 TaxID=1855348 RepID=UPI00089C53F1|nr:response regulator [Streptomyces sp. 3213.3]SED21792.1 Response regulator receiver domain-containing protein [Streptomyces sp. 3213] [Streptomyces sp. 3213.3]